MSQSGDLRIAVVYETDPNIMEAAHIVNIVAQLMVVAFDIGAESRKEMLRLRESNPDHLGENQIC